VVVLNIKNLLMALEQRVKQGEKLRLKKLKKQQIKLQKIILILLLKILKSQ
jgi:hypothetical protein